MPTFGSLARRGSLAALFLLLLAVGVGVGVGPAGAEEPADGPAAAIAAAHAALEANRIDEAISLLEEALDQDIEPAARAPLARLLAQVLVDRGEVYAALRWLEMATTDGDTPEDHLALAENLLRLGRENAAAGAARWMDVGPYLEDALAIATPVESENDAVRRRRARLVGEAAYWLGRTEEALAAWDEGALAGASEAEALRLHDLAARAAYGLGRYPEAARHFAAAGNVRGEASAWAAGRDGARAIAAYGRLLRARPGDRALLQEAHAAARYAGAEADLAGLLADLECEGTALAGVLLARGRLAEASELLDAAERFVVQAVETAPDDAEARYELGRIRLVRAAPGDADARDAATAALIEALGLDPQGERSRMLLWSIAGTDYSAAWRDPRALARSVRIQQALVAADEADGLAWANLGNTLRVAGRHEEALAAYDRAVAAEPGDATVVSDRGLVLSALGRSDQALAAFEEAARLDPDYDAAHQNAARMLWLAGRDADAERHLAEAERRTRAVSGSWMRYRFLLDRTWRTRHRPSLR